MWLTSMCGDCDSGGKSGFFSLIIWSAVQSPPPPSERLRARRWRPWTNRRPGAHLVWRLAGSKRAAETLQKHFGWTRYVNVAICHLFFLNVSVVLRKCCYVVKRSPAGRNIETWQASLPPQHATGELDAARHTFDIQTVNMAFRKNKNPSPIIWRTRWK